MQLYRTNVEGYLGSSNILREAEFLMEVLRIKRLLSKYIAVLVYDSASIHTAGIDLDRPVWTIANSKASGIHIKTDSLYWREGDELKSLEIKNSDGDFVGSEALAVKLGVSVSGRLRADYVKTLKQHGACATRSWLRMIVRENSFYCMSSY